jgi:putative ABC transport system permease protein
VPSGAGVLPEDYISLLGFHSSQAAIGQEVTVAIRQLTGKAESETYKVVAVIAKPSTLASSPSSDDLLLSQSDAKAAYNYISAGTAEAGRYVSIAVYVRDGTNQTQLDTVKSEIEKAGYSAESIQDTEQFLNQIINVLQVIILVFGFITLIASFFGVVNTQYISVLERTREIGLMKALGMSRRTVNRLFIIEATWIGFLGAVLGSAGAVGLGSALNPWLSRKLNFGSDRLLVFEPKQIALLVIFLMFVTTIAGLLPARKASKLDPIEALRTE